MTHTIGGEAGTTGAGVNAVCPPRAPCKYSTITAVGAQVLRSLDKQSLEKWKIISSIREANGYWQEPKPCEKTSMPLTFSVATNKEESLKIKVVFSYFHS